MTRVQIIRTVAYAIAVVVMFAVVGVLLLACGRGPGPCRPAIGTGDTGQTKRCVIRPGVVSDEVRQ